MRPNGSLAAYDPFDAKQVDAHLEPTCWGLLIEIYDLIGEQECRTSPHLAYLHQQIRLFLARQCPKTLAEVRRHRTGRTEIGSFPPSI
jgi:hypothetical protein